MCNASKVARPTETDSPYESRAETKAAVERIHEHFTGIKAEIAKEKQGRPLPRRIHLAGRVR